MMESLSALAVVPKAKAIAARRLTKTEYAILKQLFIYQNQVVSKSKLLDLISFDTENCDENSLRVHISNIRKKIKKYSDEEFRELKRTPEGGYQNGRIKGSLWRFRNL